MAIEIRNVTKNFGKTIALNNVSVKFEEDKIYGLLGNNGAGKSTMMSLITNRLFPTSGEVLIDGESVDNNDKALSQVFMMGERNLFPEDMRVKKAFSTVTDFYPGFDKEKAARLCEKFGLKTNKKITALSTGYKSIFRLVIALCVDAKYLLLDEPVLGLDALHRDMFYRELIEDFANNPRTIIVSTHLIGEVEGIVEHAVIIRDGDIITDASVDELVVGACSVTGPVNAVEAYVEGRKIISKRALGGLLSGSIIGGAEDVPAGLEVQKLSLQDYFISIMEKEETK